MASGRKPIDQRDCRILDVMVVLVFWTIWKERSRRVFDSIAATAAILAQRIREEAHTWIMAGFHQLRSFFEVTNRQFYLYV